MLESHNAYGSSAGSTKSVCVDSDCSCPVLIWLQLGIPRQYVGFIIGRGGETIKRISQESGAKVQFDQGLFNGVSFVASARLTCWGILSAASLWRARDACSIDQSDH